MRRAITIVAVLALAASLTACGAIEENRQPWCRPAPATALMSRSVPSATLVPCVRELPSGWVVDGFTASDAGAAFALVGPETSEGRVDVAFTRGCGGVVGATVRSDERAAELSEEVRRDDPFAARWTYRFDGGCARIDVSLGGDADVGRVTQDLRRALSFVSASLVA